MKTLALALGGCTAVWMAAPLVAMTARGTIDQRAHAAWRATAPTAPQPLIGIPAPRRGDVAARVPARPA